MVRIDPSRRSALAIGVCVVLVAAVTLVWVISGRPSSQTVDAVTTVTSSGGTEPRATTTAREQSVVVDVAGKVRRPGVYTLSLGARVIDAVRKAGGPLHGVSLTSVNLAARLVDGQQIVIGAPVPPSTAGATSGASSGPLSLNSATLEQLDALPGVGPVLAQNILDYRQAHGRFDRVDQLNDVPGIGPAKFTTLRSLVTV